MGAVAGVTGSSNEQPHTSTHRGDRHRSVGASLCQSLTVDSRKAHTGPWAKPKTRNRSASYMHPSPPVASLR